MAKPITTTISCSRSNSGDGGTSIRMHIEDQSSRAKFLTIEFTLEQFANVLTGVVTDGVPAVVRGLENVGKRRVSEPRTFELGPERSHISDRAALAQILRDEAQEPGWTLDTYLGSQNSITTNTATGGKTLHYRVYRFEDA